MKKKVIKKKRKISQPGCANRNEIWKTGPNSSSPFLEGLYMKVLLKWLVTKYSAKTPFLQYNHPSILAFQNRSHILFPRNEWWSPCVIKYSTSQQCFIKKVHEFLKLFCKSLWKLTMKANTSAGVQMPSYPHRIQPDTGICGTISHWYVRNLLLYLMKALPPHLVCQATPHTENCSGTQGQFCDEELIW